MIAQPRKMSEIMKEMAQILLHHPRMVLPEKSSSSIPLNRRIWTIPESSTSTKD